MFLNLGHFEPGCSYKKKKCVFTECPSSLSSRIDDDETYDSFDDSENQRRRFPPLRRFSSQSLDADSKKRHLEKINDFYLRRESKGAENRANEKNPRVKNKNHRQNGHPSRDGSTNHRRSSSPRGKPANQRLSPVDEAPRPSLGMLLEERRRLMNQVVEEAEIVSDEAEELRQSVDIVWERRTSEAARPSEFWRRSTMGGGGGGGGGGRESDARRREEESKGDVPSVTTKSGTGRSDRSGRSNRFGRSNGIGRSDRGQKTDRARTPDRTRLGRKDAGRNHNWTDRKRNISEEETSVV